MTPRRTSREAPAEPTPPYDQALANQAAAIDHCLKLGAVTLKPKPQQGFAK